ncbi:alpha/beta hydrolase [Oenococcus sp. UCMA 17063]|nr:alpha/beta hydrolase [Oenococcus sp. UCMA 17063]
MQKIGGHHLMVKTADGIRWHLVEAGVSNELTVLLVAGFPESAYAWRRVIPILAKRYHVFAIDLPGQGYSSVPASGFDTKTTSERIQNLLSKLNIGKCIYVGHDVGSWVGFAFAHLFTKNLFGVALIDGNIPNVTLPNAIPLDSESWRSWHFLFNALPDLPETLLKGNERELLEWFFSNKAANWKESFSKEDVDEYEKNYTMPGVMRGMLGYYRAVLEDIKIHKKFIEQKIKIPILAVSGELGSSRDLADKLTPFCEKLHGETIPKSGHYVPEEEPQALCKCLSTFIDNIN